MADGPTTDEQLDGFLEIRKPGAHLEEGVVADDFVLMLGVDLVNYPKFPKVDDSVTYTKKNLDIATSSRSTPVRSSPTTAGRGGRTCGTPTSRWKRS